MTVILLRGNALHLPLPDASVDLVVTSPPYFGLRSYRDGGEHYAGQVGAEATPQEFLDALIAATQEMARVLKPNGSIFLNLGDRYVGGGMGRHGDGLSGPRPQGEGNVYLRHVTTGMRSKSLMLLPERYRIRAVDELGLIARAVIVWAKSNGLPESVTDRVRRSHEDWVHLTKQPRYFSAVDEIRETTGDYRGMAPLPPLRDRRAVQKIPNSPPMSGTSLVANPLGKLPGSVWEVPTQPLIIPDRISHARCCGGRKRDGCEDGLDHYAAFPMEWPRRLIQGWSPNGVCVECEEGRRPVAERDSPTYFGPRIEGRNRQRQGIGPSGNGLNVQPTYLTGYACACPEPTAPTRPAVVLDPFGGTGTATLVASTLGRIGISVDMSADYCWLAQWRTTDPGQRAAAMQVEKPAPVVDGQGDLFSDGVA